MNSLADVQYLVGLVLALVFVVMGVLHFVPATARGMAAIIPEVFTRRVSRKALVRITGVCEILGGVGLVFPATHTAASIALIVFLIAVFPANAFAARHPERFGRAAIPFWPRLVAQLLLIAVIAFQAFIDFYPAPCSC